MGPEIQITAQLADRRLPVKSASKLGIQVRKDIIVTLPAIQGYFKIRPDQSFPDIEFLDGRFNGFLIGSIRQSAESVDGHREDYAENNQYRHHFK